MRVGIPRELSSQERVEALVELLAEGVLLLAEKGQLKDDEPAVDCDLSAGRKEGSVSHGP